MAEQITDEMRTDFEAAGQRMCSEITKLIDALDRGHDRLRDNFTVAVSRGSPRGDHDGAGSDRAAD